MTKISAAFALGVIALIPASRASAETRLFFDAGVGGGESRDVVRTDPADSSEAISPYHSLAFNGRAGLLTDHLNVGTAATFSFGLFRPGAATLAIQGGPALTTSDVRIELLFSGGVQLHDALGAEYSPDGPTGSASLPFAGAEVDVWLPVQGSSAKVAFFLAGRRDIGAESVTATIQPGCFDVFLCAVFGKSSPVTASYAVGGTSLWGGIAIRLSTAPSNSTSDAGTASPASRRLGLLQAPTPASSRRPRAFQIM